MDAEVRKRIAQRWSPRGLPAPTFIQPILDTILLSVPKIAPERAIEFCGLLEKYDIHLILDHNSDARFSASPPLRKAFLGVDGLERSWAYSYFFTGAYALFLAGSPQAISTPASEILDADMLGCLNWAIENDAENRHSTYPEILPKPTVDPYRGSDFERLHFNSFVSAVAWITLHEVAHIVLEHSIAADGDLERLRREELEADMWAADWLMSRANEDERLCRINGITVGLALAAHLELWVDAVEPPDHPIYPRRLLAMLDRLSTRCGTEKQQYGLWLAGAVLVFQRAAFAGKEELFEGIDVTAEPQKFIERACEAYPDM